MQKEKNQTVLERKQQMEHLITHCLAFILLERSIWGCSLAPKGEFTQYPFFVRFCPFFYVFASP